MFISAFINDFDSQETTGRRTTQLIIEVTAGVSWKMKMLFLYFNSHL